MSQEPTVKRHPVDFDYNAINPDFLHRMARIAAYAAEKYGSWEQYRDARLRGDKSPINHIFGHLKAFRLGERYDRFDGDPRWHLVAVAYNCMMEYFYVTKYGFEKHPLTVEEADVGTETHGPSGEVLVKGARRSRG
jgi:hypothetical protein